VISRRHLSATAARGWRRRRNRFSLILLAVAFTATAFGQNWVRATDIPAEYVDAITSHAGLLFAATDSAVYSSADSGASWSPTPSRPATIFIQTLFSFDGWLYLGSRGDGVFRTNDGGGTWEAVNGGLAGGSRIVIEFASRGDTLYAGTGGNGVYVLGHGVPPSWSTYNAGLFQLGTSSLISSGTALVAAIGQYVFHRQQGAAAWSDATIDSIGSRSPIKLHRHGPDIFLGTSGGVFRGDSSGATWVESDITQFPGADIVAFASYGPRCYAGLNYIGQHWIFSTDDRGAGWDVRAHEFAEVLALYVDGGTLWAARTDGLWGIDIGGTTGVDEPGVPRAFSVGQNYPNPFNPSTTFSFTITERSRTTLTVYDALGRLVASPVDRVMEAGIHTVRWDAAGISSGTYLYRIRSGNSTGAKKLLIVR
jgi:hypothetical protein